MEISPLPTQGEISISVYSNRIFVNATELVNPNSSNSSYYYPYQNTQANATKVSLFAFVIESGGVSSVFNFTDNNFVIKPEIEASPQLTKVFVVGNGNVTSNGSYGGIAHGFHIDWATKTVENITMPDEIF